MESTTYNLITYYYIIYLTLTQKYIIVLSNNQKGGDNEGIRKTNNMGRGN